MKASLKEVDRSLCVDSDNVNETFEQYFAKWLTPRTQLRQSQIRCFMTSQRAENKSKGSRSLLTVPRMCLSVMQWAGRSRRSVDFPSRQTAHGSMSGDKTYKYLTLAHSKPLISAKGSSTGRSCHEDSSIVSLWTKF